MKKVFKFLTLLLLCVAMLLVASCSSEVKTAKWCNMVYMDMGNLVPEALKNLDEITSNVVVNENSQCFILTGGALLKGTVDDESLDYTNYLGLNAESITDEDDKKIVRSLKEKMLDNSKNFTDSSTKNTVQIWSLTSDKKLKLEETLSYASICDCNVFIDFLDYCDTETKKASTADEYQRVLTMWGFGGGSYNGMLEDWSTLENEQPSSESLSIAEFQRALEDFDNTIDILNLDMSNMQGFEMAYAMKGLVDFIVGSQADASSIGLDYATWTAKIATNPTVDEFELAKLIASSALAKLGTDNKYSSWSVIDMRNADSQYSVFGQLEKAWSDYLFNVVNPQMPDKRTLLWSNLKALKETDVVDSTTGTNTGDQQNIFNNSMYDMKAFVNMCSDSKASLGDPNGYGTLLIEALNNAVTNYAGSKVKNISSGLSVCIIRDESPYTKYSTSGTDSAGGSSWYSDYKTYCAAEGYKYFLQRYAETD